MSFWESRRCLRTSAVAVALEGNKTLLSLDLHDNGITDEGAEAIALALENNTSLTHLDLQENQISARVLKEIEEKVLIFLELFFC
jgi:Ran GTPase-activating protein (RanGAP) involved in mRNA processing and transport